MSKPGQPATSDLPSDPLLKPGTFIDANGRKRSSERPEPPRGSTPNGAQPDTPVRGSDNSSSPAAAKGKRRVVVPPETWLPPGWLVEDKVRTSGATAGSVDKYYVDPSSGRKFRSRKEVLHFLETGLTPNKKKKGTQSSGGEEVSARKKNSDKKPKPLNFDFVNVPEKVDWFLTNASADSWTPFIRNAPVPESTKHDWAVAYTSLSAGSSKSNSNPAMF